MLKALAKRPADRYPTAAELADDLARFLNHEPVKARRISPLAGSGGSHAGIPGITGVTTAAAAAILAIATFAYVRVVAERDEPIARDQTAEGLAIGQGSQSKRTRRHEGKDW